MNHNVQYLCIFKYIYIKQKNTLDTKHSKYDSHFFMRFLKKELLPVLLIERVSQFICGRFFINLLLLLHLTTHLSEWWARRFIEFSAELVLGLSASDVLLITVFGSSKSNLIGLLTTISFVFNRSRIYDSMLACWRAFELRTSASRR